uniref:Ig-like domain-containing protein n=1 Tax=Poecilia formosa TaxID=48698 RepID=A0A087X3J9_POEFO
VNFIFMFFTKSKNAVLTIEPNWSTFYAGEFVTFICDMNEGKDSDWYYQLRRNGEEFFPHQPHKNFRVQELDTGYSGEFQCCGYRMSSSSHSKCSKAVTVIVSDLMETVSNKVVVTRRPNWPQMFSGEMITLTCEVQGGETTEWTCEWSRDGSNIHRTNSKDWTFSVSESSSGDYMCQCRRRDDSHSSTQWSEAISLSVSTDKPTPKLTAGSTTIPVGGSVTVSCSVEPSAGWKYRWFRKTSDTFVEFSTNNEENRDITVRQGGIYRCHGERGNPSFYSHSSYEKSIEITFSNKVVVTQQPNWPLVFSGETITLTCEVQGGETTEWTCEWRRPGFVLYRTNSKDWIFNVSESSSGDYMCRCRSRDDWFSSTQWSEAFTLSVSGEKSDFIFHFATICIKTKTMFCLSRLVLVHTHTYITYYKKYRWWRRTINTPEAEISRNNEESRDITVTQGGIYRCDGERGNPSFYSQPSNDVTI